MADEFPVAEVLGYSEFKATVDGKVMCIDVGGQMLVIDCAESPPVVRLEPLAET